LRYLREIFESLLVWAPREKDTAMLCECVRIDLGRFITHRFIDAGRGLRAITLDAQAETQVRASIQQGANGSYLAMPPDVLRELLASAGAAVAAVPAGLPPVLLATPETRRFLRRVLAQPLPQLNVLSYGELPADVQIHALGRISLPRSSALRVAGS